MSILNIVSRSQLCDELNCHRDSIKRWIKEEGFPEPLPCPAREPLFDKTEVNSWIRGQNTQNENTQCRQAPVTWLNGLINYLD
jgi:predicted DNA-binding transcriptional regulator AlpA